jgi:hypothetical protein
LKVLAALLLLGGVARADGVRFEARVPSENITLDQTVELTVTLERDGNQVFESYRAPLAPDFDLLHTGSSEQMQMSFVNGRQSMRMLEEHVYILKPKKKGALTIAPATVRVAGQPLQTRPIVVHVAPVPKNALSTVAPPSSGIVAPPVQAPESLRGDEDLYVDAQLDKPRVYVGEQVTASWRLFTQSEILKYRSLSEPKHEDFWCEDLFVPQKHLAWDRLVVKGREYAAALLLKKGLFPLKAGKLTVTPLEAEATTMQSAFYANASAVRRSSALSVEVRPLPAEGRPLGFDSANVGQLEIAASVDRAQVKAGEAVTWKVVVKGAGNLRNVKLPKLDRLDGFKVYEPTMRENIQPGEPVRGEKTYLYLLMPERGGALTVPPLELPYFDPAQEKYLIARTQPIAITVEGDPTKMEAAAGAATAGTENVLAAQIRPIRNRSEVRSRIGDRLWRGRLGAALLIAPPGAWLLILLVDGTRRRLARETARSKRRRARRTARRRLRVAEYHIKAQRPSAFFGECARVIYEHLEYRLGAKVEALTLSELRAHLESRGFPRETADAVVQELETCDFARFAPSASGPGEMRAALRRVRALLGMIESVKQADREVAA